jgi:hypothetical protein
MQLSQAGKNELEYKSWSKPGPVVQKLDSAIHQVLISQTFQMLIVKTETKGFFWRFS